MNDKEPVSSIQDNANINFHNPEPYEFDFDKVRTVEDIIAILKGMNITIYSGYPSFDELEPYLKPKDNE